MNLQALSQRLLLIFKEKGKGDEAVVEINRVMLPFRQTEGASWKIESLMGVTDSFKVLGKSR